MASEEELFASVDALLEEEPQLPPPAERARLREAAGITQARLAVALKTSTQTVKNYENGRSEPKSPRLEAYQRLLKGWAAKYPAHTSSAAPAPVVAPQPEVPGTFTGSAAPEQAEVAAPVQAPAALAAPERPARSATSRRPAAKKAAAPAVDPRFPHGPLAVLDGDGSAYGAGGIVLDCPATTIPELVEWTLRESGLGAPKLNRYGKDSDPLIVLTAAAAVKLGLPERLEGHEQRRSLRLPEDHPVVKQVTKAKWQLTQRGFGPWARIYRKAQGRDRQCVQLAVLSWDALDERSWPGVAEMEPADIARVLGVYAMRVITPRGSTAVSGLELMTALRPPTKAVRDEETGNWVSGYNAGSLGVEPMDPAPPEATPEHPVVVNSGWKGGFLNEEAYQWVRSVDTLSDEECTLPYAVGLDLNTAFLAAAARLVVGLSAPDHFHTPTFNPKIPGSWLADLSHIELDPRLPSPFTPDGSRPTGAAWYQTHTLAYAQELGHDVHPIEAYLRRETGAYLDPWHDRLKNAYVDTLADVGVTKDLTDVEFLAAMEQHKQNDPALAAVLAAIKATVKGGVGKLRERPQGKSYKEGETWPALARPTWRPDIRAAVISKARVNMHRKLNNMVKMTGLYPLAVLSDCVVYPSPGTSPLDFLPYAASGKPQPGGFRLGATPGLAKLEGVQSMLWAVDLMEKGLNPARHIKGGDAVLDEGE
ncbi:telomere-associated protein Tap [Streptomyces albidoflavus]|jgi:transcriptional regulator with XRE-family HTH domain|uniref:Helix-turn-helix domain-containing protein n=1 Tax=Streptomyces albidoflavus TaxID=1886 RepID=A0AB37X8A3_9ACTN|nr:MULTISPECIES: helix-turn-helix domain-containing protein [Streptomyces]MYX83400.1 helix-turn-helix domain-containing protein [Streptomyces sp. SID4915]QLA55069.1 helix-turn-helix domain-containing protein [Streptomyces violascens]MBK3386232.1 helix-turn-helix domain-containing protein [Streptomyces sp. DEF147AK]RZD70657.1 helix-turn-helix domain-containing protein [Streptomyces albidoflavus]RZE30760.1 helix-turn-helix domain-containing protein [Streptomyces albidoflavus]